MRSTVPGTFITVVVAATLIVAPIANAEDDVDGYVTALDRAGLIDHDGDPCNIIDGLCHGQFGDGDASIPTGRYVCRQIESGRSRDSIVYELSHGEGLMPSSYNAPIIYDAASRFLC